MAGLLARILPDSRPVHVARFLYHQRVKGFLVPDDPWFDAGATEAFNDHLSDSHLYVEFGTGGSTLLAGRLGKRTVSVESDPYFARAVAARLSAGAPVRMIHADIGLTLGWGVPAFRTLTPARRRRWLGYVTAPYAAPELQNDFPDFVLVDGRFRRACALEAARRARLGSHPLTIMVDDYAERTPFRQIETYLGAPRMAGWAALFVVTPDSGAAITGDMVAEAATDWN